MPLKLYRRHRKECEGGHPEDARTGEFEEGRRGWKKCGCVIHVSGTLAGKFSRKQTGKADWEEAKALAAQWEKADSWDGKAEETAPIPEQAAAPARVSVSRAITAFTVEFEEYAAEATRKKYKRLLKRLQSFSDTRGHAAIDEWTPLDVREFRSSWPVSARTAARNMSSVRAFFEFCRSNQWIEVNPAKLIRNPPARAAQAICVTNRNCPSVTRSCGACTMLRKPNTARMRSNGRAKASRFPTGARTNGAARM